MKTTAINKKPASALKDRRSMNGNTVLLVITIALFIVMYAAGCIVYADKGFTHFQTFLNILINNAGLICVACGMTCVMLTGGIDISVGSLIALDCMLLAKGMSDWGIGAVPMCLIILAIGIVMGIIQGFCVGYLEIQPFIVTMAGMFFARGLTAVVSTAQLSITQDANATFYAWANTKINLPEFLGYANKKGIIQVPYIRVGVIVAIVVLIAIFLVLRYTKFGRSLYAVGGHDGPERQAHKDEGIHSLELPVLHRRHLLLPEHHAGQRAAGLGPRDGRHRILGNRRYAADGRRRQRHRFVLRRAHKRHDLHNSKDQRQTGQLLAQHPDRGAALLLHSAPEHLRQDQGKVQVRRGIWILKILSQRARHSWA